MTVSFTASNQSVQPLNILPDQRQISNNNVSQFLEKDLHSKDV